MSDPSGAEPADQTKVTADRVVVAIDGPSGSGKSTVARGVARRLKLRYLDTGAMYRAAAWAALEAGVDLEDQVAVGHVVDRAHLTVRTDPETPSVRVDGIDVGEAVRTRRVTAAVSAVSAVPSVRERMVALQRQEIGTGGIVVEGRDIGSTVAPGAHVKVFLTASSHARAERRSAELDTPSSSVEAAEAAARTREELRRRDEADSTRSASPLRKAPDAVEVDSTGMSAAEVVDTVVGLCRSLTA